MVAYTFTKQLQKFKQILSATKLMATVFWDRKGVLMAEFMQQGTIITSQVYYKTLKKLHRAGHSEQKCGILIRSVVLLHDNAHPYTAACTQALLDHFNWELFDQPPYSPDLVPSDYHLSTNLKNWLGSQHFNNNELMEGVKMWLSSQVADFFHAGIQ
jgi:hypothetical protein